MNSNRLMGWDLPPGVTTASLERAYGYEEEEAQPRCAHCGAFLAWEPERREPWEESLECDGQVGIADDVYTQADAGILDIIGWEFLGKRTNAPLPAACGEYEVHAPHHHVMWAGTYEYRTCQRCGHLNQESLL
jgi:hypothetical protein